MRKLQTRGLVQVFKEERKGVLALRLHKWYIYNEDWSVTITAWMHARIMSYRDAGTAIVVKSSIPVLFYGNLAKLSQHHGTAVRRGKRAEIVCDFVWINDFLNNNSCSSVIRVVLLHCHQSVQSVLRRSAIVAQHNNYRLIFFNYCGYAKELMITNQANVVFFVARPFRLCRVVRTTDLKWSQIARTMTCGDKKRNTCDY